jgi:hypothetical protein
MAEREGNTPAPETVTITLVVQDSEMGQAAQDAVEKQEEGNG